MTYSQEELLEARRQISSGRAEASEEKICPGDGFELSGDCLRKR